MARKPQRPIAFPALSWPWVLGGMVLVAVGVLLVVSNQDDQSLRTIGQRLYTRATIAATMSAVARSDRNIPYCGTKNPAQQLDLYVPKQGAAPYPVVVFVHGGGWTFGNKTDPIVRTYGTGLVKQGVAFASLNYRLAPKYHYPEPDQDVGCALTFLYGHAARYQIDKSKFGLFGASAGGQLAAYAVLGPDGRYQPWWPSVRGVVDFYGVSNLTSAPANSRLAASIQRFLGPDQESEEAAASPVTYANQPAPPFLVFHGTRDRHVPFSQSQELVSDLTAVGDQATLVTVDNGGHGFGPGDTPSVLQIQQQVTGFFVHVLGRTD